jgi:hypothetical protein
MTSTAIQYQPAQHDLPMPKGNGTFIVFADGTLMGHPESSAVSEWNYLVHTATLVVEYKGSTKQYFYEEVPSYKVFQMLASESIGAFIAKAIKPHHQVWSPER